LRFGYRELRTPEATAAIEAAFGVAPFDLYATTEGLWGSDCERRDALYLYEDDDGRPVPDGAPGARLLVTNLAPTASSRSSASRSPTR
jgi:phenylacetate-coenzyme A ligase PaaK-like adenylate-forming protein